MLASRRMVQYQVLWVRHDHSHEQRTEDESQVDVRGTSAMTRLAAQGWEVISVAPGTNASTYSGLFITFQKK